jgi:hypothetical protein
MKMRDFVRPETARLAAVIPGVNRRVDEDSALRMPSGISRAPFTTIFAGLLVVILALLAGCDSDSSKPPEAKPEPKPTELLTGRAAFYKVFVAARSYADDIKPFRVESTPSADGNGQDGKAAIWTTSFASASRHSAKPYIWSGTNAPNAPPRGVSHGTEDSYNPSNASTQVFDQAFLKVDTDQAFAEAQKHGGDKVLEKDPTTSMLYICDWNHNTNELVWHVIYGPSRETAKLTVAINASSGTFIRVEK